MSEELNLFDFPKYKITKDIRLIELFAGVGSQMMSLRNLKNKGIIKQNVESWYVCEFDKYAIASYNAIHGTDYKTSDVTQIHAADLNIKERDKYEYILTYSFPCTDLSMAGKGLARKDGMTRDSSTRSGLLWQVERLLLECGENLPQVLLMENVPQVLTTAGFSDWTDFLKSKGYINHYQVMNAKNYGVAQNRERAFMISFLADDFMDFQFPSGRKLDKCINVYLEQNVDEKYFISDEKSAKLIKSVKDNTKICCKQTLAKLDKSDNGSYLPFNEARMKDVGGAIASTLLSRYYKGISNGDNMVIEKGERK